MDETRYRTDDLGLHADKLRDETELIMIIMRIMIRLLITFKSKVFISKGMKTMKISIHLFIVSAA